MLKNISLERPLAAIDLETTGLNPQADRIVEIGVWRALPTGEVEHRTQRLNPGVPIYPQATAVHGITDADVAALPPFEQVARGLLASLDGCDLCGFNLKKFDLPFLHHEFKRAGLELSLEGRAVVDAMEIYHRREPRNLSAAVRYYLGREHGGAHGAQADVSAIVEVLDAMVVRYDDLPRTIGGLQEHLRSPDSVDADGRFTRVAGEVRFAFGKYYGQPLDEVARREPGYLDWILNNDFLDDVKQLVRQAQIQVRSSASNLSPCGW